MSRERLSSRPAPLWRCLLVWSAVSVGTAAALPPALAGAHRLPQVAHSTDFTHALVALASLVLGIAAVWLWVITTSTVLSLASGRLPATGVGVLRRTILLACGVAVAGGVTLAPAYAQDPSSPEFGPHPAVVAGLPLPDRTLDTEAHPTKPPGASPDVQARPTHTALRPDQHDTTSRRPTTAPTVRVRTGDSLWSIASAQLPNGATAAQVDAAWRAIWHANLSEIGRDPDQINPGQRLALPDLDTQAQPTTSPPTPGDEEGSHR